MKRFIHFCGKIKYLGLLGLPSLFVPFKLFDYLWLFWLFGLIEIFYNFPVFLQSLRQLWGMLIVPLRYGKAIPNINNYHCRIRYSLPLHGSWVVVNGGPVQTYSHSWSMPSQRYAYDFLILDDNGKSHSGSVTDVSSYYCYGKEVLAPADGEVVEVGTDYPDSILSANGQVDCSAKDIRGNHLLLRHAEGEYSLLAHLSPGSIRVKCGDKVSRGQCLALCGNSGNSSEPHLHFQLQNGISFYTSAGLPIEFEQIAVKPALNYSLFDPRSLPKIAATNMEDLSEKYIFRGQSVRNLS